MKNRVLNNAAWIIGSRIVQSLLNLLVGMLSARYLGPSNYGLITYVASIVSFFVPLMGLGLGSILVQELSDDPEREGTVLGTALGLNIPSALLSMAAAIGFVCVANQGEKATLVVCAIYSLSLLFQATEMITYWFQAKLLSKYPSIAMVIAYACVSGYKIILLASKQSVYWFAAANALDHLVISAILLASYFHIGKKKLQFSRNAAKKLLSKSKYYIFSGLMITVFQQTDRLMIKNMIGSEETGYYSAAVVCAGIFGFVYAAIIDSFRPVILNHKKYSKMAYENSLSGLYSLVFYSSLIQCIMTVLLAEPMIRVFYGEKYLPAVAVLRVSVWFVTYSYFGSIRNIWILCEEKYKHIIWIDLFGALLNVALNALLIPFWGIVGAAFASVLTQFGMNFLFSFVFPPLKPHAKILLKGLNPILAVNNFQGLLKKNDDFAGMSKTGKP